MRWGGNPPHQLGLPPHLNLFPPHLTQFIPPHPMLSPPHVENFFRALRAHLINFGFHFKLNLL